MTGPRFRTDLIIATLALLASASASIATVVQTRVVGNQLSAAVWPYLSFTTTTSPTSLVVTIDNDGLGPALLRSVTLDIDGRPKNRWRDALALFGATRGRAVQPRRKNVASLYSYSEFGGGTVIRPAASFQVLRIQSERAPQIASVAAKRVSLNVCYCSILEQCWRLSYASDAGPAHVDGCGTPTSRIAY